MSWLREHDGEVLDDRMGDLTHLEYRACHALRQYLAREANESGIFHQTRANRAVFSTPNGVRKLTQKQLRKLIQLELVVTLESLTDADLEDLGIERPEGSGWLRPSHWERYNPPRDATNAARQKRYRDTHRNAVTEPLRNGTLPRARDRGPVPSLRTTSNEVVRPENQSPGAQALVAHLADEAARLGLTLPAQTKGQCARTVKRLLADGMSDPTLRIALTRMLERSRPAAALTDIAREVEAIPAVPDKPPDTYDNGTYHRLTPEEAGFHLRAVESA